MNPPYWIRAAVAVSVLADEVEDFDGYGPALGAVATAHARRLRGDHDRAAMARGVVGEVLRARRPDATPRDGARGEVFLARWLRGVDRDDRAKVLASLPTEAAQRIARRAPSAAALGPDAHATATWMVAASRRALSRWPDPPEWTELFEDLTDDRPAASPTAVRLERMVRVMGRRGACAAVAREVARA